ncbi:MAG: hypothetical protein LBP26_00060 [Clostridiales bacterium]|jgi:hypothetical protein|nr:hypothetical protein [Clostridiales bacterium]
MKIYESVVKDGMNAYVVVRAAKNVETFKSLYSGNGEFVYVKNFTDDYAPMFSDSGLDTLKRSLLSCGYGNENIDIIVSLMQNVKVN